MWDKIALLVKHLAERLSNGQLVNRLPSKANNIPFQYMIKIEMSRNSLLHEEPYQRTRNRYDNNMPNDQELVLEVKRYSVR